MLELNFPVCYKRWVNYRGSLSKVESLIRRGGTAEVLVAKLSSTGGKLLYARNMKIYKPEDAFRLNIWILTIFGAWPQAVKHPFLRFIYNVYGYGIQLFYVIMLLPMFFNLYFARHELENLIGSSTLGLTCFAHLTKLFLIMFRAVEIQKFFKILNQPIFAPRQKEHLFVLIKYQFIAKASNLVFLTLSLSTATLWSIFPFVKKNQKYELLLVAWYPYDTSKHPHYIITYISQVFVLLRTAVVNATIDTLITNFYVVMMGQIEILKIDLKHLADIVTIKSSSNRSEFSNFMENRLFSKQEKETEQEIQKQNLSDLENTKLYNNNFLQNYSLLDCDEETLNKRIIKCTEHYKEILRYIHDVTKFFEIGIVSQVCASTIVICTSTYEMTLKSPATIEFYVVLQYQVCMLIEIFLYTWRCNDFTLKAMELKDAVYECEWMSVPNLKFRKSLCIIMSPLQIPIKLSVGKFFILSVETFFKIIKMAYTVFVLLKQMNNQRH